MSTIRRGLKKRIVVNRHMIKKNKIHGTSDAVLSVQTSKGVVRGNRLRVHGPMEFVYDPAHPLKCGATVWVETTAEVEVDGTE